MPPQSKSATTPQREQTEQLVARAMKPASTVPQQTEGESVMVTADNPDAPAKKAVKTAKTTTSQRSAGAVYYTPGRGRYKNRLRKRTKNPIW